MKARKPRLPSLFMDAAEVAALVGGYAARSILDGCGPFSALTRYRPVGAKKVLYLRSDVEALIEEIKASAERVPAIHERHLRAVR